MRPRRLEISALEWFWKNGWHSEVCIRYICIIGKSIHRVDLSANKFIVHTPRYSISNVANLRFRFQIQSHFQSTCSSRGRVT